MTIRCLLLDFDGALADSLDGIVACMRGTFLRHDLAPPTPEQVRATIGLSLGRCFERLRPALSPEDVERWVLDYREQYAELGPKLTRLFPGARELLRRARAAGLKTAIASNKGEVLLRKLLERLELLDHLDAVAGEAPGRPRKPDPSMFHELLGPALPGVSPGECLVLGDTATDLRFARNLGAVACFAAYGYGDAAECLAFDPEHVIRSLDELPGLLGLPSA